MAKRSKVRKANTKRSPPRWRSAQARALEGGEDARAMASSLLRLASLLHSRYELVCCPPSRSSVEPLSAGAINQCIADHRERRSVAFLNRARASGKRWKDVAHFLADAKDSQDAVLRRNYLNLLGWQGFKGQLLEGLCLLAALTRFGHGGARIKVDVFGANGPLPVVWADRTVFLWTQAPLPITRTGLKARPDLLCSRTDSLDRRPDIEWIVEAKCRGMLTSHDLRAEFGKAFDLEAPAYTIVSFNQPGEAILRAAREFGIDIQVFPLIGSSRSDYINGTRKLEEELGAQLGRSRDSQHFAQRVLAKGEEFERKLLRP